VRFNVDKASGSHYLSKVILTVWLRDHNMA
jgi:hypothetical protein